jgi:parallel beta-helix repeat protein
MAPGDDTPDGLSRRAYLKLAGASAAAAGLAGCEATREVPPDALSEPVIADTYGVGPAAARPESESVGFRYFAVDTGGEFVYDGERWRAQGVAGPFVDTGQIRGVADRIVRTTAELERAFRNLERGDTIRIGAGVYRPSRWLTVDASDVTVIGESRKNTLIRPADGANVGGFHVGPNPERRVENVLIEGVGFDGNERTMDDAVKRCHAFLVEHASQVTIRDCFATRTHPYHEHDSGGSGFTVRRQATDVSLVGNYTDDIGDRSIQVAGSAIRIAGNRLTNGFDRAISLDVRHPDGPKYYARNVGVVNNVGRDNSTGSIIGASQGAPQRPGAGNYAIVGNVAGGTHRRTVYLGIEEAVRNVAIVGNTGRQADFGEQRSGIYVSGNVSAFTIAGNTLADYSLHGIELEGTGSDFTVTGNTVLSPRQDGIRAETDWGTITGNVVESPGRVGIDAAVGDAVVGTNAVRNAGADGIRLGAAGDAVVATNRVSGSGRTSRGTAEIRIDGSDCVIAGNVVSQGATFGIREAADADGNVFLGNRVRRGSSGGAGDLDSPGSTADDRQAWHLHGPRTRLLGNSPAPDRDREVDVRESDGTARVRFDRPYARKPILDVQTETPADWTIDWHRDDAGNLVGADLAFTDRSGAPASPTVQVGIRGPE